MLIRMAIAHKRVAGDCGHDRFLEGCVSHRKNYDRIEFELYGHSRRNSS